MLFIVLCMGFLVGVASGMAIVFKSSERSNPSLSKNKKQKDKRVSTTPAMSSDLANAIEGFHEIKELYRNDMAKFFIEKRTEGFHISRWADETYRDIQDLFEQLSKNNDVKKFLELDTKYSRALVKINKLLSKDFCYDIIMNPHRWENPDKLLKDIRKERETFHDALIRDCQQSKSFILEEMKESDVELNDEVKKSLSVQSVFDSREFDPGLLKKETTIRKR